MFDPAAAGWQQETRGGFGELVGPIWMRHEADGHPVFGFEVQAKHANKHRIVHGGMLLTFADHAFGSTVVDAINGAACVTLQLNAHFVAPVLMGQFVEARAEVVKRTRSVAFVRGRLTVQHREVMSADGIWKILGEREIG